MAIEFLTTCRSFPLYFSFFLCMEAKPMKKYFVSIDRLFEVEAECEEEAITKVHDKLTYHLRSEDLKVVDGGD